MSPTKTGGGKLRRLTHDAWIFLRLATGKAFQDGIALTASALAFVTLLSLIPLLAVFSFIGARAFQAYQEQALDVLVQVLPYSESALRQMILPGGHRLGFEQHLVGTPHGHHGFPHAVLHALDDRAHPDQRGHPEHDAEHGQKGPELVGPDLLESDQDGVEKAHQS